MNFQRQTGIVDMKALEKLKITVVGAGAVGSFTTVALAKMGAQRLTVYDDDKVESHNIPNQYYPPRCEGQYKVEALKELVLDMTGTEIKAVNEKFEHQKSTEVMILTVDSMGARRSIWNALNLDIRCRLYIDTRMGAEVAQVYTVPDLVSEEERKFYEECLWSDDEVYRARCSERSIVYTPLGMAGFVCSIVKKYIMKQPYPRRYTYDFVNMIVESIY